MKKLLLIGGGGHCHSVLDSVMCSGCFDEIGIVDQDSSLVCRGVHVVGQDADLCRLHQEGWTHAFVCVGSIGKTIVRRRIYESLQQAGFAIPNVVDPSAIIAGDVLLGEGIYVGKRVVINAGSSVEDCAIINTGAIVEHDCRIGCFAHIAPGTVLCGAVCVGNDAHVGAGSVVRQQICIGNGALIGSGSVVVRDIPDGAKAYGNPCKVVE